MTVTDSNPVDTDTDAEERDPLKDLCSGRGWELRAGVGPTQAPQFLTSAVAADMLGAVHAAYEQICSIGYTTRAFQGALRVEIRGVRVLEVWFGFVPGEPFIFDEVVRNKAAVVNRTGASTSRLALQANYGMSGSDYMFEGGIGVEDIVVAISGFEAPVDGFLSQVAANFLIMNRNFVMSVLGPALSVEQFSDSIAADDPVGQALIRELPPRVVETFPVEVKPSTNEVSRPIDSWLLNH